MKKTAAIAAAVAVLICLVAPAFAGGEEDDLKVIKRAVKGAPEGTSGKSMKWFKVLITDNTSGTEVFKVTLPIIIVRYLARGSKDRHMHTDRCDIDIAAALRDLEELSPLTLLEIVDDESTIKIWLE